MEHWRPDTDMREAVPIETTVFHKEKLEVTHLFYPAMVQERPELVRQVLEARVTGYLARRVLERVEVKWPADWWQALRERWFPSWWLRRWPVRYERRRLEAGEFLHRRFLESGDSRVAVEVWRPPR
jgi:hypothetical protein